MNTPKKRKKPLKTQRKRRVKQNKRADSSVQIMGMTLFGTRKSEVLNKIGLQRKEMLHVATVNSEYVMEARTNARFKEILAHCYTIADGWGVVWGVGILGIRIKESVDSRMVERISGVELVEWILARANQRGEKVFLLGARPGVAEKAAGAMAEQYPGAVLAWFEGARTVAVEANEEASMTIAKINGFEPDYLLVAYGSPWQDIWIEENRPYLRVRVAMGVGGVLDEWAGVVARCPAWVDGVGLKWVWRVANEPWRWKRILKVLQFGALVMYHKLID